METNKIEMLVQLRQWVIDQYGELHLNVPTAQLTHKEVGQSFETIIRSLEDVLKDQVNFE